MGSLAPTASTIGAAPLPSRREARRLIAQALGLFAVSRIVTTLIVLLVVSEARSYSRIGSHSDVVRALGAWDGQWYEFVALRGYPAHLPVDATGATLTNAWAFLPAYPMLVKVLSLGFPTAWLPTAEVVSTIFGFGAAVLLALLLRPHVGDRGALIAVAALAFSPVAFILQGAYAESMGLFLTFGVLCLVDRSRYLLAIPPATVLAFTRPGVQALALTVGLQLVIRVVAARRRGPTVPRRDLLAGSLLTVFLAVAGFAWDGIAAWVTGVPDAYLRSESAWRILWTGNRPFSLFTSWAWSADFWFGGSGPVALGLLTAGAAALLLLPVARRIGTVNLLWTASYALYLAAVFFPQTSLPRLLMPAAPLGGALTAVRSRAVLAVLLILSIALQGYWFLRCYGGSVHFWTVP